ncbi:MAG TPA: PLP-dependent aspartate aminotransferase family protein [Candidatus Acidoferrales bacterium]|nr:PLP-dependent aspartate aminotransferase family protein [Candidatus Acidoferrales bacterium]
MGFATDAIHVGQEPDPSTGAIIVPIYQTSTYVQEELGKNKGYEYARSGNPTRTALERNLARLEGGTHALAFASGMAAINAVMTLLRSGDHVICSHAVYGGVYRLFTKVLMNFGLEVSWVNTTCVENVEKAVKKNTRLLYVETPTNPTMEISDLAEMSRIARVRNLQLVVDNTFMSPYLQRPLELGADMVVHSTTKFLNGHSDSIGGAVILRRQEDRDRLYLIQKSAGAILGPMDCWLVLRGVKTLAVRMEQHNKNSQAIAEYLEKHPKVKHVYYPGLPSHPQYALAKRQMKGFGAMLSFELGSLEAAQRMLRQVKVCSLGESLGGVETLISHPATMTHASVPAEERAKIGITDGLVRISVGIEDVEDVIADLDRSLGSV